MPPRIRSGSLSRVWPWCAGVRQSNGFLGRTSTPHSSRVKPSTLQLQKASRRRFSCGTYGVFYRLILGIRASRFSRILRVRSGWQLTPWRTRTRNASMCVTIFCEGMSRMESLTSRTQSRSTSTPTSWLNPWQGRLQFSQELHDEQKLIFDRSLVLRILLRLGILVFHMILKLICSSKLGIWYGFWVDLYSSKFWFNIFIITGWDTSCVCFSFLKTWDSYSTLASTIFHSADDRWTEKATRKC